MFVGMFLIWGVVIVGSALLIKGLFSTPARHFNQAELAPHDILFRRYVCGEISRTEYDRMLRDLS
jgi:uncharacterized membrane protein